MPKIVGGPGAENPMVANAILKAFETGEPVITNIQDSSNGVVDAEHVASTHAIGQTADVVFSIEHEEPDPHAKLDEFGKTMHILAWIAIVAFIVGGASVLISQLF